ncbi:OBAP family protein [Sinorhizobium numidicum]|uniref:OBAP family protein n=1 Tax=Sinorhizobium numidicum TaxID=680248 RepID=A0ABY8CSV3_9HYPH|nr:DUF1264 domain-containing protein [Sinorhizobium numidicum]WEX74111.1 OBAP family protein [Sinorhizobium numidicum]WEX80096.1 OBAP family protein [Sinorhizobium numidicum]
MNAQAILTVVLTSTLAAAPAQAAGPKPAEGFSLHVDAKLHFPGNKDMIAHHYCKAVAGMTQCLLFDSDNADAHLVGVEVIVGPDVYNKFDDGEKKLWHYHRTEVPKVSATLPDLSEEEAKKVLEGILETYGKVYLLWDPGKIDEPTGNPSVTLLE